METGNSKKTHRSEQPGKGKSGASSGFPVVGIGASAGGLEALEQFFGNMPKRCGMAFVVIQHLDPNHAGIMPELLQRITSMKVAQAADHLQIKPDHVYVIPPNKSLSILKGFLYLFEPVESRGLRLPVDFFFRSLADDQHENSIGIILSGMGSDGSLGLKSIKENNGVVAVQDPESAKFDGMPRSALNSVIADITAPADELAEKLIAFLRLHHGLASKSEVNEKSKSNLEKIVILLQARTGHDFSLYKKSTLFRRTERRMGVHQIDKINNYVRYLQGNPHELDILFKEMLIGVTNFFRDPACWEYLKHIVLPALFKEWPTGYVLRAWVVGCSTGEEAYTLAIIFKEAMELFTNEKNLTLQIFATDIDSDAIERARKGFFSANIVANVSPERINRFFIKEDSGFRVHTSIREMVVFAPHNVIKDPPFTKLDLLLCRNLLIYMEAELQKKLMGLFHYALLPVGVMMLGNAESVNSQDTIFSVLDSKLKIYKRLSGTINTELLDFPSSFKHAMRKTSENIQPAKITDNIQILADQLLIQRFSPASVLINAEGDILYITGRTGKYLEPAAGKANMNIYAMAREGLHHELPAAIRKARQNFEPVKLRNIKIGTNGGVQYADVTLQQIDKPEAIQGTIMVVFADIVKSPRTAGGKSKSGTSYSSGREKELEIELQRVNEELQSTREEMQTTQEELKSTNEEMQSTNEELQSTNEELTTSKEEMQSLNEELQTVNIELQSKIADFVVANNDMKNLLNSTDIATLFLDKELNIRRFTDQTTKLFKLRQTDIGRPFTELVSELRYPEITEHAREVMRTLVYRETEISTNNRRWFTVRIMPYRTLDDRIDGLVITFVDNTPLKLAVNELFLLKNNFESTLLNSNVILALCDNELRYTWIFNQEPEFDLTKVLGRRDDEIALNAGTTALLQLKKLALDTGKPACSTITFPLAGGTKSYHIIAQPVITNQGAIGGVATCSSECFCEKPV